MAVANTQRRGQSGKIIGRNGQELRNHNIEFDSNGKPAAINNESVELVEPSQSPQISGIWLNNQYSSSGCFGGGYCSYSYSERIYRFEADGRFIREYSSQLGSTLSTAIASSSAFGSSSNDSTGYYEIMGNRLFLTFDNGDRWNQFIHQARSGDLAIDNRVYGISGQE